MKNLFDTHCHLNDERYGGKDALIEEIRGSDIKYLVNIGTTVEDSILAAQDAAAYDFCYAAAAVYPQFTKDMTDEDIEKLRNIYIQNEKVVAFGEMGLDYHYDDTDKKSQQYWFARQIQLACELDAPICIHSRDADEDTMRILKENHAFENTSVLMHCFSGSAELAKEYVRQGAVLSICGPVTFKNARKTIEVVREIPIEHLVAETDSPYLTPEPHRGQVNKPFYVAHTIAKIAEIKGMSFEEAADAATRNACRFYNIPY